MQRLKFITKFPYLIEFERGKFTGILHLKEESIGIKLSCPEFPNTTSSELFITKNNEMITCDTTYRLNAFDLMSDLEKELKGSVPGTTHEEDIDIYSRIFQQLKEINSEFNYVLSEDYQTVTFSDLPGNPGHFLELKYDPLRHSFQQRHSLPDKCSQIKGRTVKELLDNFNAELAVLEEFYGNLSDIDELCFVIAPVPVTTRDTYRIFKFNEKVFLKITLDPTVPSNVQLSFIGPLDEVDSLRQIYCKKIGDWDVEVGAHKNLLQMFDLLYFPYRPDCNADGAAENKTCSICFEFNLDNTYPIITCFNPHCEVIFHAICLQKWFETLTDAKTFCTVTTGMCPYCKQKLTMFVDIYQEIGQ